MGGAMVGRLQPGRVGEPPAAAGIIEKNSLFASMCVKVPGVDFKLARHLVKHEVASIRVLAYDFPCNRSANESDEPWLISFSVTRT